MASSRSKPRPVSRTGARPPARNSRSAQISSEEAIRAGEQIAMAAFASGLKLAAAFGTVAAKTAGLALSSLAMGADKFSELVKQEAMRSYKVQLDGNDSTLAKAPVRRTRKRTAR